VSPLPLPARERRRLRRPGGAAPRGCGCISCCTASGGVPKVLASSTPPPPAPGACCIAWNGSAATAAPWHRSPYTSYATDPRRHPTRIPRSPPGTPHCAITGSAVCALVEPASCHARRRSRAVRSLPGKSQGTLFRLEHQYCSCAEFNRRVNVSQTPSRHGSAPPSGAGMCGHVAAGRSAIKTRRGWLGRRR
jgi:hypothetical protein